MAGVGTKMKVQLFRLEDLIATTFGHFSRLFKEPVIIRSGGRAQKDPIKMGKRSQTALRYKQRLFQA
jgi:hypothetical protein